MVSLLLTPPTLLPLSLNQNPKKSPLITTFPRRSIPCRATSDRSEQRSPRTAGKFDRRDVLLGLGGLAGLTSSYSLASAAPVPAPDIDKCHKPEDLPAGVTAECCPPKPTEIIDYKPVPRPEKLRVRHPAHDLDGKSIAKYERAMALMRALPDDDPRSFKQQADVHCAYCNDAYDQVGFEGQNLHIQVHLNWFFSPFHRWQLYFYERILGKLIDDPSFTIPFWNWDHPDGMQMPAIYADPASSLYDPNRNPKHQPPVVIDLQYDGTDPSPLSDDELIKANLSTMYRQMVIPDTPELFFGKAFRNGGPSKPGIGALENTPHNKLHRWGGNPKNPNGENLGNLYSSGKDPLFYPLHVNCDRLWDVWRDLPGPNRRDFADPDWLDSTFVFYDEEARLVRVKVRDCLRKEDLGYTYRDVPLPWLNAKPKPFKKSAEKAAPAIKATTRPVKFPLTLDKAVSAVVARPEKRRSKADKEARPEVVVIQGVEFDKVLGVCFEVYINDEDQTEKIGPGNSEFVGAFSSVPGGKSGETVEKTKTDVSLSITAALDDLDADDDDTVVVTLVPKSGAGKVTIDGIKIEFA